MRSISKSDRVPDKAARTRPAAALTFSSGGVQAAVTAGDEMLAVPLHRLGLSPASLTTVREDDGDLGLPSFPSLLDRLGEDRPVPLFDRPPQKPHLCLGSLLAELTVALQRWWGPLECLGIVVSAYANDLQRSLVLRAANRAGWQSVELVNKTTAVALEALQRRPSGHYLVLALGHDPAEASVVQWEGRQLRALSYSREPDLSGDQMDRLLLLGAIEKLKAATGKLPPVGLYDVRDWMWMQGNLRLVRENLSFRESVGLEIPALLTDGSPEEVVFERAAWEQAMAPALGTIEGLVRRCCSEAGVKLEELRGCLATGGLLLHTPVLNRLRQVCGATRLTLCPPDAPLLGACRWASRSGVASGSAREIAGGGGPPPVDPASLRPFRIAAAPLPEPGRPSSPPPADQGAGIDLLLQKVRALAGAGKRVEAKRELAVLKEYVQVLELSLEETAVALKALEGGAGARPKGAEEAPPQPGTAGESRPVETTETATGQDRTGTSPQKEEKSKRRKFLLAKDDLKKAEQALREGQLELAVRLSHRAYQTSDDGRIFKAMIDVHLRASRRRPATPETFDDDRRWLLCALNDDQTSEAVQNAVSGRFLQHVEQLVERGTERDHSEAISVLHELMQFLPGDELAQKWLRQLKEAASGSIRLIH